jgi:hypothetical protein
MQEIFELAWLKDNRSENIREQLGKEHVIRDEITKVNESNARVTNDRRTNYYSKLSFRSPQVNKF